MLTQTVGTQDFSHGPIDENVRGLSLEIRVANSIRDHDRSIDQRRSVDRDLIKVECGKNG
jgi:hypothetical protein